MCLLTKAGLFGIQTYITSLSCETPPHSAEQVHGQITGLSVLTSSGRALNLADGNYPSVLNCQLCLIVREVKATAHLELNAGKVVAHSIERLPFLVECTGANLSEYTFNKVPTAADFRYC